MIRAAVLGSPISHSLSPALHNRAYEFLGIPGSYTAIELTPESALAFFQKARFEEWTGFSLTMPLKEAIFDLPFQSNFEIDPITLAMRSANTLLKVDEIFQATSTDRSGFIRLFAGIEKRRVAIIGGGGTARAALSALDGTVESIDFLLRTPNRSSLLSQIATKSAVNFYTMDHSLRGYDLVISTVPSGAGDAIAQSLDFRIPVLCEVLYNPYPTPLLAKSQSLGSQTVDGMDLLVEQAMDQISLFSGMKFDLDEMRNVLQKIGRSLLH